MQTKESTPRLTHLRRTTPQAGEVIDRATTVKFTFDGKEYTAHPGDTIASALAAAGVKTFSRSFKYHRPRGLMCCSGHCPNCMVQVADEPDVRACRTPVEPGMAVTHQNAWPSLELDAMATTQLGDRFLPVGFYYKTFIHPKSAWPMYERVLRNAAGLGVINPETHQDHGSKQFLHCEVAVIGGGPAGMSAALAAAECGAQVMLFDENDSLGGHLRYSGESERLKELKAAVAQQPNITVYSDTTVLGWFQDNWLPAMRGNRLYKIRAQSVIVATGAYEQPLVFDNNDLPGVMLGSGVQRLLKQYGVLPGRRAVVVTANDDGWNVAADLQAGGIEIGAIVDERERDACQSPHRDKLSGEAVVYWKHTIAEARGESYVRAAYVAPINGAGAAQRIDCDLIAVSVGWTPVLDIVHQSGGKTVYDEKRGEILPKRERLPANVFVAGRAAGTHGESAQLAHGRSAGHGAASFLGKGAAPAEAGSQPAEAPRTSTRVLVPGRKKRFVCFCEDVTDKDIKTAIAEGYDSLELLKRYATTTMGPCQGKMCALNTIHLCARANGVGVPETGVTTSRQPYSSVKLETLAGQHMEPAQITPVHAWHTAHGAKMMLAGLWIRPLHYGDPVAEVKAVREHVGLIDVSTLGKLRFTGPGVGALLDKLYINAFKNLGVGRVRYGVMCTDEGVVLDDGVTARLSENEWYTTTTTSGAGALFENIQWWMQSGWGDGAHLADLTEQYSAFNLAGPRSRAVLQKLTAIDLTNETFPYMHIRAGEIAGVPCRVMRIGFTGELSYEIHVPSAQALPLWEALVEAGAEFGLAPFGVEAQRVLRLEKAHIIVSQDTDATTDPLSADLGWAVKLDKPDFLGKRSIMRIARDGPQQKLVGFQLARRGIVPEEGLQCVRLNGNGQAHIIGNVTSSRHSPTLNETIGLCWLPWEIAEQNGATFTIRMLDGKAFEQARVHHGPFFDPEGKRLRM
ncbi:MAG: 2Fe-2S iron-sulfur cluster-binding protein [Anaerolineales bacterium]